MEPGYRSPLIDVFRRTEQERDVRLLAAQGALSASVHEQLALLVLLSDDPDPEIGDTAQATIRALPEAPLRGFLARGDVSAEMRAFFAARGVAPAEVPAPDASEPLPVGGVAGDQDDEGVAGGPGDTAAVLANLPIRTKIKLASKGTREQRAQLVRDPNKLVAAAVLSSPKLTDAEVESFAKMANVAGEVLRVIGTNRIWLKNYGTVLGLVKNPKTPPAISMQLLQRLHERDLKMVGVDRNVPDALRLAARKFVTRGLR